MGDREYLGTVTGMHLNSDYAAVLFDNRLQVHLVDDQYYVDIGRRLMFAYRLNQILILVTIKSRNYFLIRGATGG